MLGVYDFCGHYEWTFAWLHRRGGKSLVCEYWDRAIHRDSQAHASQLILKKGIEGMKEYWGHTLQEEAAEYHTTATDKVMRIDMHACPSKGFLIRNHLNQYCDYCDHCIGWIGPMMLDAGFVVDHEHNHAGQCWWEIRRALDTPPASEAEGLAGGDDVRSRTDWATHDQPIDVFRNAVDASKKI